jgi:ABC-type multidrug transport system ATPase subunit
LLNTLAGRIEKNTILEGEIFVDGKERDPAKWKLQCAYVEQDDILFPNLTVFETIMYSAKLRIPRTFSIEEKTDRVNKVILMLGLEGCRNTKIGDSINRGISGGERKRVSIGIELVTDPQILFLDEPTSGLDAFNAFNAMETLKKLAKAQNKIILLTIHQPRTDILDLFDKVILLTMGQCVWFGSTHDAIEHFGNNGFKLPPKTNPSDFFLGKYLGP